LKILEITPRPSAEETAAIAAALLKLQAHVDAGSKNALVQTHWLRAARAEALDDGV
jgi:hypothetical protein